MSKLVYIYRCSKCFWEKETRFPGTNTCCEKKMIYLGTKWYKDEKDEKK